MLDKILTPPKHLTTDFGVSDIILPNFQLAFNYWQDHCNNASFPEMTWLDPLEIPTKIWPLITIVGLEFDPAKYIIRFMGRLVVEKTGINLTGKNLTDLPDTEQMCANFNWVANSGKPYMVQTPAAWAPKNYYEYDVLTLPFGTNDKVERLMVIADAHGPSAG